MSAVNVVWPCFRRISLSFRSAVTEIMGFEMSVGSTISWLGHAAAKNGGHAGLRAGLKLIGFGTVDDHGIGSRTASDFHDLALSGHAGRRGEQPCFVGLPGRKLFVDWPPGADRLRLIGADCLIITHRAGRIRQQQYG